LSQPNRRVIITGEEQMAGVRQADLVGVF